MILGVKCENLCKMRMCRKNGVDFVHDVQPAREKIPLQKQVKSKYKVIDIYHLIFEGLSIGFCAENLHKTREFCEVVAHLT